MATQGNAVPLCYGYAWATGQRLQYYMMQNTGNSNLDYTRTGFWLLGEGEWDGLIELWDAVLGVLYSNEGGVVAPGIFNFHSGCDAVIGSGSTPSIGPDQGQDLLWNQLPPGLQPLHYNRWAYYVFSKKQEANGVSGTPSQSNANDWTDINPIGLWRTTRCRIFSSSGSMVGYAFTRNPAWHFVDLVCRRKLFPEYNIVSGVGPTDLPTAIKARFDWGAIAETAAYFGQIVASGMPRFCGDYSFTSKSTLQACLTQILTSSRSFIRERAGQLSIVADQPRASVFTFSRANADITEPDSQISTQPNMYIGAFKDLLVPACATIASITGGTNVEPVITTEAPHCLQALDYIVIGNTGTTYDGYWQVLTVPAPDANGNVYQATLSNRGSNYPAFVGSGGLVGLRYSRFKDRSPQFEHHAHQLAFGATAVGATRYRNRRATTTDFANCTWDQVSRVSSWQRSVALGPDQQPYITPATPMIKAPFFAADSAGSGAIAAQVESGDVVTIDATLSTSYAGEYEVVKQTIDLPASTPGQGMTRSPKEGAVTLYLRPYSDGNYPDASPANQPGIPDVPGLPGQQTSSTVVPLEDGGTFAFFTASMAAGNSFELPDGYNPNTMMAWASPQGFVQANLHCHYIMVCDAYDKNSVRDNKNIGLTLLAYSDGTDAPWSGDVNVGGVAWNSGTANAYTQNGLNFVEVTLAGGETVLFAKGFVASETVLELPSGYSWNQCIALAFPYMASDSGNPAHGFGAWVDSSNKVHHFYQDGEGHTWEGTGAVFLFAWKNNMGSWKNNGNGWFACPLSNGQAFAVLGASILDASNNGAAPTVYPTTSLFQVPTGGKIPPMGSLPATTLQCMTGPNGFVINGNDAHGVRLCQVDSSGNAWCTFEDGEGNVWPGSSGVFGLLCDVPTVPII